MSFPETRHIHHPGPVSPERTAEVAGEPVPLRFVLEPGHSVDAAISKGFAASGCIGGFVMLRGVRCEPFRFVMPAASSDDHHAAWFSDTFAPEGPVEITRACAIVGQRDGNPFIHCHGIWETTEGTRMGHMLAPDTVVAEPMEVTGIGLRGATFKALLDLETNFILFEPLPVAEDRQAAGPRVLLAKVRPNEDVSLAIENICSRQRIRRANVHGVGSLNGVRFADGGRVDAYATEVLIHEGRVESAQDRPSVSLQIDVVDMDGQISSGCLVHGDNPVCVTFELVIEEIDLP